MRRLHGTCARCLKERKVLAVNLAGHIEYWCAQCVARYPQGGGV
jgi:hypothetical protein